MVVTTASKDSRPDAPRGAINGGIFVKQPGSPQHPSIVIGVDDVGEASRRITDAGWKIVSETLDIPGVGLYVTFVDTEGNQNSIIQPKM